MPPAAADLTIRPAAAEDLDEVLTLVRELAEYERMADQVTFDDVTFGRHLFGPDSVAGVLLAECGSEVAGFALWFRTFSTFLGRPGIWLEDLFVRPAFRDRGIGRALLADLRGRTEGRVEWAVLDWNEPAKAFYRRLGAAPLEGWEIFRWPPAGGAAPA